MRFILEPIDCDNEAFQPDAYREIVSCLRDIANRLERNRSTYGQVNDSNGNKVSFFRIEEDFSL